MCVCGLCCRKREEICKRSTFSVLLCCRCCCTLFAGPFGQGEGGGYRIIIKSARSLQSWLRQHTRVRQNFFPLAGNTTAGNIWWSHSHTVTVGSAALAKFSSFCFDRIGRIAGKKAHRYKSAAAAENGGVWLRSLARLPSDPSSNFVALFLFLFLSLSLSLWTKLLESVSWRRRRRNIMINSGQLN